MHAQYKTYENIKCLTLSRDGATDSEKRFKTDMALQTSVLRALRLCVNQNVTN
jgi:hypothetical protein